MGVCLSCESRITENLVFYDDVTLRIKERDRLGKVFRSDKVSFKFPLPLHIQSEKINLAKLKLNASSCIIGGLDPRLLINKECQDGILTMQKDSISMSCVFDGHGIEGLKIVEFTKEYIKSYFSQHIETFKSVACSAISLMITECDRVLRNSTNIDCSISGTTAVVLLITDVIHVGSVGDSRCIIGIVGASDPEYVPNKRHIDPPRSLFPMRLTVDQKPNLREELERIKKAGGKVQQLTNEQGVKIGPYRIWKKTGTLPGLAMSRSIGDSIGKEIGVIAEPMCHSFMFDKDTDLFIVIASDGLWDVMNNTEVLNFVEVFRKKCRNEVDNIGFPIKVRYKQAEDTVIAHFLAEEARFRWLEICQDEDVMIDDIAIIVIQLEFLDNFPKISENEARKEVPMNSCVSIANSGKLMASHGDAVRGSFVPAREVARRRIDPKRGSYVNENQKNEEDIEDALLSIPFTK